MNNLIGKECYVLHSHDYSGEENARVFFDELKAYHAMIADMEEVVRELEHDGYMPHTAENDDSVEVWVSDEDIYYEWSVITTEIE